MTRDHIVVLKDLVKKYDDNAVLDGINLSFIRGETTVIIGGSGAGKTTLIRHIVGLEKPTSGQIFIDGEDIVPLGDKALNRVRQKVGMVYQYAALLDSITVFDNVAFPLVEHTKLGRKEIRDRVMEGLALPAGQLVPEGFFGVSPNLKPEPYDPDGAKKLLAEAGYPGGFGITLHGPNNRYVNDDQIVQAVAQMLTRIGIVTKVETLPFSVYVSRANKVEFSAALLGWGVSTGEATYPLRSLIATYNQAKGLGTWNWGRYSNPQMDALLEQGLATVDNAKREKLLQQATELVINDYGLIPLHYQVNTWAARKGLGYTPRTDERT